MKQAKIKISEMKKEAESQWLQANRKILDLQNQLKESAMNKENLNNLLSKAKNTISNLEIQQKSDQQKSVQKLNQTEIMISEVQNELNESIKDNKNLTSALNKAKEVTGLLEKAKETISNLET